MIDVYTWLFPSKQDHNLFFSSVESNQSLNAHRAHHIHLTAPQAALDAFPPSTNKVSLTPEITIEDVTRITVLHWYYNGILYDSTASFRSAWQSSAFEKIPPNLDGSWTDIEDFGDEVKERELPPPVMIQPLGPRYKIERKEKFVSWSELPRASL